MSMLGGSYAGEGVGESSEGQSSGGEGKGKATSPTASGFLANFSRLSLGEPDAGTMGEASGSSRMEGQEGKQEGTPRPVRMFNLFPQKHLGKEGDATAVGGGRGNMLTDMFADAFSFRAAEGGTLGEATGSGSMGTYTGKKIREVVHRTRKEHSNRREGEEDVCGARGGGGKGLMKTLSACFVCGWADVSLLYLKSCVMACLTGGGADTPKRSFLHTLFSPKQGNNDGGTFGEGS
jgi:hypothetical protein